METDNLLGMAPLDILDHLPQWIWLKDLDGKILYVNKTMLDGIELRKSQIVGKKSEDLFNKRLVEYHITCDKEVMNLKIPLKVNDMYSRADGTIIYIEATRVPVIQNGALVGILGYGEDVTKEYVTRELLRDSISRLEKLLPTPEEIEGTLVVN